MSALIGKIKNLLPGFSTVAGLGALMALISSFWKKTSPAKGGEWKGEVKVHKANARKSAESAKVTGDKANDMLRTAFQPKKKTAKKKVDKKKAKAKSSSDRVSKARRGRLG